MSPSGDIFRLAGYVYAGRQTAHLEPVMNFLPNSNHLPIIRLSIRRG